MKNYIKVVNKKKASIRKTRSNGLKKYDIALEKMSEDEIIEKAIASYKANSQEHFNNLTEYFKSTYGGENQEWSYFHYSCFLTIVRDILISINKRYASTSIGFNLDEAITKEKIDYIAKECNITQTYDDTYPRDLVRVENGCYLRMSKM